jgi:hypothetical protein
MDWLNQTLEWLRKLVDYNRYTAAALGIGLVASALILGCQSRTPSLIRVDPATQQPVKVTRAELAQEVVIVAADTEKSKAAIALDQAKVVQETSTLNADIEKKNQLIVLASADLDKQDALKAQVIETLGGIVTVAAGGTLTPATGIAAAIQLITLLALGGTVADNARKDTVITTLKVDSAATTATTPS